jgi:arylsulfatase
VTADIIVPKDRIEGVIIAVGGFTDGWSLYTRGGKLKHCYNFFGVTQYYAASKGTLPEGRHQVRLEFEYAGGGPAKGGKVTLYVDGKPVADGQSIGPNLRSSRRTKPATSARSTAQRLRPTIASASSPGL